VYGSFIKTFHIIENSSCIPFRLCYAIGNERRIMKQTEVYVEVTCNRKTDVVTMDVGDDAVRMIKEARRLEKSENLSYEKRRIVGDLCALIKEEAKAILGISENDCCYWKIHTERKKQ
jgi:hypothetical protein